MPLRFTLRQLEYLVAVGDAGSIALASARINVSSPSISAAISQLEAEFGVQLFVRQHAQGLSLTPGGRRIFNEARQILHAAGGLIDLASDITRRPRGPLSVGALITVAPYLSAPLRRSFETAFPEADLTLREGHHAALHHMLSRAEIDVALTYDLDVPKDYTFAGLIDLPPWVILPRDHDLAGRASVDLAELAPRPMVLLDLPHSREYFLSMFQTAGLRPNITERTSEMAVARSLVANGFGYGLLNLRPHDSRSADGENLAYVPLDGAPRPMVLGLMTKRSDHMPRIVRAFEDHLRALVQGPGLPGLYVGR